MVHNLGAGHQHVDQFPPVNKNGQYEPEQLEHIVMIMAQWYVRKDGKYYDVEEPGPVLSRDAWSG